LYIFNFVGFVCCWCCFVGCIVVIGYVGIVKYLFSYVVCVRGMLLGVCVRCAVVVGIVGAKFVCVCSWVVAVCICCYLVCLGEGWLLVVW
jgi:hypothetical protein